MTVYLFIHMYTALVVNVCAQKITQTQHQSPKYITCICTLNLTALMPPRTGEDVSFVYWTVGLQASGTHQRDCCKIRHGNVTKVIVLANTKHTHKTRATCMCTVLMSSP